MKKHISLILVIIWMAFIFYMSSLNANISSNQSNFIVNIISNITNITDTKVLTLIVRKLAHFTEYFILGLLLYNCIINYHKSESLAVIIAMLYAISDEIHQIYVPGRSFKIMDIIIDITGSILAIVLLKIITSKNIIKKAPNLTK